jgi:hypothetical protein
MKALDKETGKEVAIKFTYDNGGREFVNALKAFNRETQENMFLLNHHGVNKLLGVS